MPTLLGCVFSPQQCESQTKKNVVLYSTWTTSSVFIALFFPLHGYNTYDDMINISNRVRWCKIKESEAHIKYGHTRDWGMFCCKPIDLVHGANVVCEWGDPWRDRPHPMWNIQLRFNLNRECKMKQLVPFILWVRKKNWWLLETLNGREAVEITNKQKKRQIT